MITFANPLPRRAAPKSFYPIRNWGSAQTGHSPNWKPGTSKTFLTSGRKATSLQSQRSWRMKIAHRFIGGEPAPFGGIVREADGSRTAANTLAAKHPRAEE